MPILIRATIIDWYTVRGQQLVLKGPTHLYLCVLFSGIHAFITHRTGSRIPENLLDLFPEVGGTPASMISLGKPTINQSVTSFFTNTPAAAVRVVSRRYLVALELALDAELSFEQIPCVWGSTAGRTDLCQDN